MSVQGGIWNFDRAPVDHNLLARFDRATVRLGTNDFRKYVQNDLAMFQRPFHATEEDKWERQPLHGHTNCVMTWDGRLDNREDLLRELPWWNDQPCTDAAIALTAFERWGSGCFNKLIGDWALCVWNPREKSLYLARDFIGARAMHYINQKNRLLWCTNLEVLVLNAGMQFTLSDKYIAGYLMGHPEPELTPYAEISALPPGAYIKCQVNGGTPEWQTRVYWEPAPKEISYPSDAAYEEQFRHLFRQSVRRRLRSCASVLADLSGGIDSSSIVCIAHDIVKSGEAAVEIDTISYNRSDETHSHDEPYFTAIEKHIGKTGLHLDMAKYRDVATLTPDVFNSVPVSQATIEFDRDLAEFITRRGHRVRLRGIGGDELLGGVQDPTHQLAEALWKGRLGTYWDLLFKWSLARKKPLVYYIRQSLAELLPAFLKPAELTPEVRKIVRGWIKPKFYRRYRMAHYVVGAGSGFRRYLPGPSPRSEVCASMAALIAENQSPSPIYCIDTQNPYLDRNLFEFLIAIPQEQLLRPLERRSLMRRALRGIVPDEVLFRRDKALSSRSPALAVRNNMESIFCALESKPAFVSFLALPEFKETLRRVASGEVRYHAPLMKAILYVIWGHRLMRENLLKMPILNEFPTGWGTTRLYIERR